MDLAEILQSLDQERSFDLLKTYEEIKSLGLEGALDILKQERVKLLEKLKLLYLDLVSYILGLQEDRQTCKFIIHQKLPYDVYKKTKQDTLGLVKYNPYFHAEILLLKFLKYLDSGVESLDYSNCLLVLMDLGQEPISQQLIIPICSMSKLERLARTKLPVLYTLYPMLLQLSRYKAQRKLKPRRKIEQHPKHVQCKLNEK